MKREKREPFMPTAEELRRAEAILSAWPAVKAAGKPWVYFFGPMLAGTGAIALWHWMFA